MIGDSVMDGYRSPQMARPLHDLQGLVDEYRTILAPIMRAKRKRRATWDDVMDALEKEADWTSRGSTAMATLVQQYGWFILRNAAAIAIVMDIEDGEAGL
jgi:hypothetical protein